MSQAAVTPSAVVVETDASQRSLAMIAHLLGFFGIVGTGIFYLVKKNDPRVGSFVRDSIKEAFNFHVLVCAAYFAVVVVMIVLGLISPKLAILGSLLVMAVALGVLVLVVMNALKANKGEFARYPAKIAVLK